MSNRNNDVSKNGISITRIETSDTISQFMEKCNNNFSNLLEFGGGTKGDTGEKGDQGVPTKPKVPIHVWKKGEQYRDETTTQTGESKIVDCYENLQDVKYQEGHLIILENAHVYILKNVSGDLKPSFLLALHSYNPGDIVDGKNAYVHVAYANAPNSSNGFITDEQLRGEESGVEPIATFNMRNMRSVETRSNTNVSEMPYMGIYSDSIQYSSTNPYTYTWIRIRGVDGKDGQNGTNGKDGVDGKDGDSFTGQMFSIDLEGDMSTISLDVDRTILYNDDYNCTIHAYYGKNSAKLNSNNITIDVLSDEYKINSSMEVLTNTYPSIKIGQITTEQSGINNVTINFTPEKGVIFPQTPITFSIKVSITITDNNDKKTYEFDRDTIWTVKGIVSPFELEIIPQYRTIKLYEDGTYYPKNLLVDVYKTIGGKKELFDISKNTDFKLLYKTINETTWHNYSDVSSGIPTSNASCLEFKVVKNYNSENEEIWDYEDVWVVADGKDTHYYHADLGNTESMMVLTTGVKQSIETENGIQYCAELRNESGYTITFNPKFYDGTNELTVTNVSIGSNSGDEYYLNGNGSFSRELIKETYNDDSDSDAASNTYTFIVNSVPYGVEMIPMNFDVYAMDNGIKRKDSVSFNVYISTITNIYTLSPTVSTFNTSTGNPNDTIGCNVYKNNTLLPISDLDENGLKLKYIVHSGSGEDGELISYSEPLVYGKDDDNINDKFTASDVAIVFILYYNNKEIVRSTVPLIKDGIDGEDGDFWQYIFCRSNRYPFTETGISNPSKWYVESDKSHIDPNEEYIPEEYKDIWFDNHQGVDKDNKYEYQSYRKWDKTNKCWGTYGEPTLYSNYSEDGKDGSGYNVMLSNPISVIPVGDDDWSVNENSDNQKDYTFIYLYNNTTDITSETDDTGNNKVSISLPKDNIYVKKGNFTVDNNTHKVSFIPVVGEGDNKSVFDFQSNTQYKLPITLTYNSGKDIDGDGMPDIFTTTVNWTLTPMKGLQDVEVFVDKKVVNTSIAENHSIRVGYYLVSSNTTKTFIGKYDDDKNTNKYQIILTDDINNLSSGNISDWENARYDFIINGNNRNCYVVLVESDGQTIVDYVNITSINDGKSAIHLELTQDYIAIPCDQNGNIHENFNDDISSKMILYNGDEVINNNITYSFKIGNDDIKEGITVDTDGKFNISKDIILGDTNIECIATYNGSSFHKILFIDLDVSPYELEMNKNTLTRDVNEGNKIVDEFILARVKYWDGSQGKWIYTDTGDIILNGTNGQENLYFELKNNSETFDRKLVIKSTDLENNTEDTEFRISYIKNTEELTYEIIGVISNGLNGKDGKSISVVGTFSTEEDLREAFPYGPDSINNAYIVGENLYVWENGDWVNLGQFRGKDGAQVYLHIKYANSISYGLDGKTISSVVWTDEDGEVKGPYQGMYSDYVEEDSKDFTKYKWFQIDAEKAVQTEIGKYQITSNTISGKTMQSTTNVPLIDGTQLEHFDDNGISLGKTTASGGMLGPAWQLNNNGEGYFAQGNIRWDANGNVRFGENVKLDWNTNIDNAPDFGDSDFIGESEVKEIITTTITKDYIESKNIIASNISATTIEGKTIKSSNKITGTNDATWQINNGGDGWLAKKNISWNTNGDLSISGKIKGSIGEKDDNDAVVIDGDLVIKNDGNISMILSGNHNYENILDIENTKGRNITLSSGLCDTLYRWQLDAVIPIDNDSNLLDGFIPQCIYTKYQYEDSKNGTEAVELYYKTEDDKYFVWLEYDSATVNSKTVSTDGEYTDGAYITVKHTSPEGEYLSYKYNFNGSISIANDRNKQTDTANTTIFSDGTIYTNSIIANKGQYYGHIYSDGEFNGRLNNASGTIKNAFIKDTDISLMNSNDFTASYNDYRYCPICGANVRVLQFWSGGNTLDLSTDELTLKVNYNTLTDELNKFKNNYNRVQSIEPKCDIIINYVDMLVSYIDTCKERGDEFGILICNDLRPIEDCLDDDVASSGLTVDELITCGWGRYPLCFLHFITNQNTIDIPKNDALMFSENDIYSVPTQFFNIDPDLSISGKNETLTFEKQHWKHQEKESKSQKRVYHTFYLGKAYVGKNTTLQIGKINITISGYQPRKGEGYMTTPKIDIYWKYVNDSVKNYICQFDMGSLTRQSSQYNNRQHTWVGSSINKTFNISKSGNIEIIAQFSANCTPKQIADYASVSCTCSSFNVKTNSTFDPNNNTITITKSGVIIKSPNGGTLSTIDGNITILSPNKSYGLMVTNDGVKIKNGTNWTKLS